MWIGKFVIIAYLFSLAMLGVGLLLSNLNANGCAITETCHWNLFTGATQSAIDTLVGNYETTVNDQNQNPQFLFGNFFAGTQAIMTLIFNVPTGGQIADLVANIPIFNTNDDGCTPDPLTGLCGVGNAIYYIIRLFISFSGVMLIISWIANREA